MNNDPRDWPCTDDDISNNGNGYDIWPEGKEETDEEIQDDENNDE